MKLLKGVYNTVTHQYEDVEVTEVVYHCFRRTGWNIDDNNQTFFAHEIQMSGLIGGDESAYENFREFISEENNPLQLLLGELERSDLRKAYAMLSHLERELLDAVVFRGQSEREYGARTGIPQKTVNNRKRAILKKIKNYL